METQRFKELDLVVLTDHLPACGLAKNMVGTIVFIYENDLAYEVEFCTFWGETLVIATLQPQQIRRIEANDTMAVQRLTAEIV